MSTRIGLNLERQQYRSRRRFVVALLSAALTLSLNSETCVVANQTRHIKAIAYYYPDKFYERNGLARPENIDFTKISRVNYASFQLDFDGNIWGTVGNFIPYLGGLYLSLVWYHKSLVFIGCKCRPTGIIWPHWLESPIEFKGVLSLCIVRNRTIIMSTSPDRERFNQVSTFSWNTSLCNYWWT